MSRTRRFLRFFAVGALGFVVDAGLTLALSQGAHLHALAARFPAFLAASAVTYALNRCWTFEGRTTTWLRGWSHYLAVTSIGALLNYLTYALTIVLVGTSPRTTLAGVALGSIVGLGFNFTMSDRIVFRRKVAR